MLITVEALRQYIDTDKTDEELEARIQALELSIRKYTNNNFQNRDVRCVADVIGSLFFTEALTPFEVGETVQVSQSGANNGLYTVNEVTENTFIVNERTRTDEKDVLVTLVEYPADVVQGAVNILKWQFKNEAANSGDTSKKDIQSETISRHSVTYATDATESDIDLGFGVPKKYVSFLNMYKKARF